MKRDDRMDGSVRVVNAVKNRKFKASFFFTKTRANMLLRWQVQIQMQ